MKMAPIAGKKRTSVRAKRARAPNLLASRTSLPPSNEPLFPPSKKDRRSVKHSIFVSKIEKSSSKTKKRRRPDRKLVANLESLADALPDLDEEEEKTEVVIGQAKIQRKSLKSRPGAMKRKEKLEKLEKDRFNKNLAQMAVRTTGAGTVSNGASLVNRWAALKSHVQSTMEKKPEFMKA
ncbi:uncharacterized protein BDR25DRAFT_342794 [Lindgomyces ingoldianus]|uniref:Uncharacterized protein n=1 Tax=Lindgomyces ingoldianus TaxID=673940 RepID=A0ACB6QXT2_9PLEO|nr:uncharacterized protein BDR25DRAFT_342794 [Lindgomyces ingoldianus]KAF2471006.1 hypothetical protein BDR25DRAFT_342794 [Lindgomyces ingoldianus]